MRLSRSALYVPGNAPAKLDKALARGADEVIVDLEDAVPHAAKDSAREAVAAWLAALQPGRCRVWVRVNSGDLCSADLHAVGAARALEGVVLAKTESVEDVTAADAILTALGSAAGIAPLLESARAVHRAPEIAAAPRVRRLQLGEADLRADLGVTPGPDDLELLFARSAVVLASAAAGIAPPLAPVRTDVRDLEGLRASTHALARLGFVGRACVHPAQIPVVHEVFTPSEDQVRAARDLLAGFDAAAAAGSGVVIDSRGRLVDEAVARHARLVLSRVPPPSEEI